MISHFYSGFFYVTEDKCSKPYSILTLFVNIYMRYIKTRIYNFSKVQTENGSAGKINIVFRNKNVLLSL